MFSVQLHCAKFIECKWLAIHTNSLLLKEYGTLAAKFDRESREQLLDAVWGSDVYVETRTVDVHIGRLRKALSKGGGDDPIRTVRSAGYALNV